MGLVKLIYYRLLTIVSHAGSADFVDDMLPHEQRENVAIRFDGERKLLVQLSCRDAVAVRRFVLEEREHVVVTCDGSRSRLLARHARGVHARDVSVRRARQLQPMRLRVLLQRCAERNESAKARTLRLAAKCALALTERFARHR